MSAGRCVRLGIATSAFAVWSLFAGTPTIAADAAPVKDLEFLGEVIIPTGTQFETTEVGGLSGVAYDAERGVFYALSDDPSSIDPARFYTLQVDVSDGTLDAGDVDLLDVTTLRDGSGQPFAASDLDPEGIALTATDELIITSEGFASRLIDPFVRRFALDGSQLGELPVPTPFLPDSPPTKGVRPNLGFESATVTPSDRYFFTGSEAALVQDGPPATLGAGSPSRLLRYNLRSRLPDRQYLYWTDPIAEPPVPAGSFAVNGLVELLALDNRTLLSMERSFSLGAPGTGNTIKLYRVRVGNADNIRRLESLAGMLDEIRPVQKQLLLDLDELGIPLDNVEAMDFGPLLPDGRRSLLLVSDNNFSPFAFTQFLLFAVDP